MGGWGVGHPRPWVAGRDERGPVWSGGKWWSRRLGGGDGGEEDDIGAAEGSAGAGVDLSGRWGTRPTLECAAVWGEELLSVVLLLADGDTSKMRPVAVVSKHMGAVGKPLCRQRGWRHTDDGSTPGAGDNSSLHACLSRPTLCSNGIRHHHLPSHRAPRRSGRVRPR